MASWLTEGCSTSLIIGEMQVKTTIKYHLTPVGMAIAKKETNKSVREEMEKRELVCRADRNANCCGYPGKQCEGAATA